MFNRFLRRGGTPHPELQPDAFVNSSAPHDTSGAPGEPVAPIQPEESNEPTPSPIVFVSEQADEIFAAAEEGDEGKICNELLRHPVKGLDIRLSSRAGHFALYGTVRYPDKSTASKVYDGLSQILTQQGNTSGNPPDERDGNLIIRGANNTALVVGRGQYYSEEDNIHVTTGPVKDGYDSSVDVLEWPELKKDTFTGALEDVIGTLALTLSTSYKVTDMPAPEQKIKVVPPTVKRYVPLLGREDTPQKTPEDISDKFGAEFPKIRLDDIGGQEEAKHEIEGISLAISNPHLYKDWGTKPPKGVLLHGPPGTGKTLLAKALASQADAAFYSITPTDISSKWYGEAEKRTEEIFKAAAANERAIVYFDEMDAVVPNREGGHEVTQRIVSIILQYMDGIHSSDNVLVVGSTNRPDSIDPAMRRPGRMDRLIPVELPNEDARSQVFGIHMKRANGIAERVLFEDGIDLTLLSTMTEGRSGADIAEIIRRTLEKKVRLEGLTGKRPAPVSAKDIADTIAEYERNPS